MQPDSRLIIMEQKVDVLEHRVEDHESRIRAGEKTLYKFIGGLTLLQIGVQIFLHYVK